ncbi:MAG: archaeosine biosynthesis radical SAM protein RaSEA [Methanimicrococcus sp.]|nr:archaeosine biosynthesis radical SAM protein RaSEA [Methanimicrococcus sp.]
MSLNQTVLEIRQRQRIKSKPYDEPAAFWFGKDNLRGEVVDVLTIIFQTSGCYWGKQGGCTMCGYVYDSSTGTPSDDDLMAQLDKALAQADRRKVEKFMVKIFTSGSFLDEREISKDVRKSILKKLADDERIIAVLAETRPEFVTDEASKECLSAMGGKPFEYAYGLETTSDQIRRESINKGFSFEKFKRAVEIAKENGIFTKAYLMLKPPFLSEKEAMEDILKSVDEVAPYAETVSINLCNVQNGTFVEKMWENKEYRPPWLWSIVHILKEAKTKHPELYLMSDPVGAGAKRGPRNCRNCSRDVADTLREFSITQDVNTLDAVHCDCRLLWEKELLLDDVTFGSPILD